MNPALKLPSAPAASAAGRRRGKFRYKPAPAPLFFPVEEPEEERVPESPRHFSNRVELWQSACEELSAKGVITSDQFLFPDPTNPQKRLAPDFLIRLGPPGPPPEHWKTWEHGRPDVAVEIISPSDAPATPWQQKMDRYRLVAVRELIRFDPRDQEAPLRVWDWLDDDLIERELDNPRWAESALLHLFFVVVTHQVNGPWLRLARDPEGRDLLLTPAERAQREAERAQREAERAQRAEEALRSEGLRTQRDMLLALIEARSLPVLSADRQRIAACLEQDQLRRWFTRAATATITAEIFRD